jgi:hypothetical protein
MAKATGRVEAQTNQPWYLSQVNASTQATELVYNGSPGNPTLVVRNPSNDGIQSIASGSLSYGVWGDNGAGFGVVGTSGSAAGVSGGAASGTGVSGDSISGWGVAAFTDSTATPPLGAVYGAATAASSPAYGVFGSATAGSGVYGTTSAAPGSVAGVQGYAASGVGVRGDSGSSSGYGVIGACSGIGVFGDSSNVGVFGRTTNQQGVQGQATGTGNGIYGITTGTGYAGYFSGPVWVAGAFTVAPGNAKSVAVAFPDGSVRRLYCVESPENWFEDFGGGSLNGGRATISLDPDFATTVQTENYRVFLTPEGPSNGLYVSSKTATGFTVQEQGNGTSNVAFSYRVVGKRKDIVAPRLEKITPPAQPAPTQVPPALSPPARGAAGDTRPGGPVTLPTAPPVQPPNRSPRR